MKRREFIRTVGASVAALSCVGMASRKPSPTKPNILLIYADDLGPGILGCYGQKLIKTPNIDKLRKQGMKFNRFYGCTVCAPARASLLTGCFNNHSPMPTEGALETRLYTGMITKEEYYDRINKRRSQRPGRYFLGELAREAGYNTAYFGKLGIGYTDSPEMMDQYGFDDYCGLLDSVINWSHYPEYCWENGKKLPLKGNPKFTGRNPKKVAIGSDDMTYTEDVWLEKCLSYMEKNRKKPFMAIYATQLPHAYNSIPEEDYVYGDRSEWTEDERIYASMIDKMDKSVGALMAKLEELKIADNTLVIFTSDNGQEIASYAKVEKHVKGVWDARHHGGDIFNGTSGQRGIKRYNFEGGLNVPTIIRWPGKVKPGSQTDHACGVFDFMPTFADVMSVTVPVAIDGESFISAMTGNGVQKKHDYMYWINTTGATHDTIIVGDWKLIEEKDLSKVDEEKDRDWNRNPLWKWSLYNLKKDPEEYQDLSAKYPERVAEMKKLIEKARQPLK